MIGFAAVVAAVWLAADPRTSGSASSLVVWILRVFTAVFMWRFADHVSAAGRATRRNAQLGAGGILLLMGVAAYAGGCGSDARCGPTRLRSAGIVGALTLAPAFLGAWKHRRRFVSAKPDRGAGA